jgi:hypothetical protein
MDRSSTTAAEADVLGFDFHREAPPPLGDAARACNYGYGVIMQIGLVVPSSAYSA